MNYAFPPFSDLNAPWRDEGTCKDNYGNDEFAPDAWVSEFSISFDQERKACRECKVRMECLVDALMDPDSEGLRGGFYFEQGKLSREDARDLWNELKLKAKVRNTGAPKIQSSQAV